jgi:FixJ family two-component response regulator
VSKTLLLLVDDDTFARTALSGALSGLGYHIAAFPNAAEAVEFANSNHPQVALLDLDLGFGPSGIDLSFVLRKRQPRIGIVFLTSYSDPRLLTIGNVELPKGARYFVKSELRDLGTLDLLIKQAESQPLKTSRKVPRVEKKLTATQIQILRMISNGSSTNQIASELGISTKSVEAVISRLNNNFGNERTQVNKRVNLVNLYYRLIGKL